MNFFRENHMTASIFPKRRHIILSLLVLLFLLIPNACSTEDEDSETDELTSLLSFIKAETNTNSTDSGSSDTTSTNSGSSDTDSSATTSAPTFAPNLTIVIGDGELNLSWSISEGASTYTVYYDTSSNINTDTSSSITTSARNTVITGLTNGTIYYIAIKASNAYGSSPISWIHSAIPDTAWKVTSVSPGNENRLYGVRYLGETYGFWTVGANNTIFKSTDGINWSQINPGCTIENTTFNDITTNDTGTMVIVGNSGAVLTSTDWGATFSCQTLESTYGTINIKKVLYTNNLYIIVGQDCSGSTAARLLLGISSTGLSGTWKLRTGFTEYASESAAYRVISTDSSGSILVAGYNGETAQCDSNCSSFSSWIMGAHSEISPTFTGVEYFDSKYFLLSDQGIYYGYSFTSIAFLTSNWELYINGSTSTDTTMYAVGSSGKIFSSSNGKNWNRHVTDTKNSLYDVACSPSVCVAVGSSGTIFYK